MTRFWITLDQGVDLVLAALQSAMGGEVFVPKIPSMSVSGLLSAMPDDSAGDHRPPPGREDPRGADQRQRGMRTLDCGEYYVILPEGVSEARRIWAERGQPVPTGFTYASNTNDQWASTEDMRAKIAAMAQPK